MATRAVPPLEATDQAIGSIPPRFGNVRRRAFLFAGLSMLALFIFLAMFETRARPTMDAAVQRLLERTRVSDAYRAPPYPQLDTGIDWTLGLALGAAGVVVGLFMGMLGMGGGVFKISCMLLVFEMDIFFARAVSIITMFFASTSALWQHLKGMTIRWVYVRPMLLGAIPAAIVAAEVGNYLQSSTLTHLFGFFTLFLAFSVLGLLFEDPDEHALTREFTGRPEGMERQLCGVVGALHGTVSGLLGISGGVIACPLQQTVLRMPLRDAITNTLLASAFVTAIASVLVVWTGVSRGDYTLGQIIFVDVFMGTGCAIGAPIGARLGKQCPIPVLHLVDFLLVFGSGLSILF